MSDPSVQPFDLHRMFLGDQHQLLFLLEVVFRTVVMYGYSLVFARAIGKRAVGQISPFEFILIIIISSAAGDPMFYAHVPLLHGTAVMTVVMLLHRLVGAATARSERIEDLMEGEPTLVIREGRIVEEALGSSGLSRRELMMKLRTQGVQDMAVVDAAYFEPSGQLSVFKGGREQEERSTRPDETGGPA